MGILKYDFFIRPISCCSKFYIRYCYNIDIPTCVSYACFSMCTKKLYRYQAHYKENGLVPRKMKSGGANKKALTLENVTNVRDFILNYAEAYAVNLPGRVPGFKRTDIQVLPSDRSIKAIFDLYYMSVQEGLFISCNYLLLKTCTSTSLKRLF